MIKFGTGPIVTSSDEEALIQIVRKLDNKESRESTWARPLGDNLYEVKGPLHLVTGVNSGDVVRAMTLPNQSIPVVCEVVRRSGYSTLHLIFSKQASVADQQSVIHTLKKWGATHELAFERFYTIEISPRGNYQAACDYLKSLEPEGLLNYEPGINMDALMRLRFTGTNYE
jgi:hypothetical protein